MEHALSILCALSSATFATAGGGRWWAPSILVACVVAGVGPHPEPVWVGSFIAGASVVFLVCRGGGLPHGWAVVAGVTAGWWGGLLSDQGVNVLIAWGLAAAVPLVSAWRAVRDDRYAPPGLREQAALLIGGFGVIVAMTPIVGEGWRTAGALNLEPGAGTRGAMDVWVMLVTGVAAILGGVHALWSRR